MPCRIFSWRVVSLMRRVMTSISSSVSAARAWMRSSVSTSLRCRSATVMGFDHLGVDDALIAVVVEQSL